jgi:hypothetical protein
VNKSEQILKLRDGSGIVHYTLITTHSATYITITFITFSNRKSRKASIKSWNILTIASTATQVVPAMPPCQQLTGTAKLLEEGIIYLIIALT